MTEAFGGKVRVVFKNYPLESVHPWARTAAIAGRCVYQQGNPRSGASTIGFTTIRTQSRRTI